MMTSTSVIASLSGLINCFLGYSTFKATPSLNIHDIVVLPKYRRQGVGQALLASALGKAVPTGVFGADMQVSLVNDGPVTIAIDSMNPE